MIHWLEHLFDIYILDITLPQAPYIFALCLVVLTFLGSYLLKLFIHKVIQPLVSKSHNQIDDELWTIWNARLCHILIVSGTYYSLKYLPLNSKTDTLLENITFSILVFIISLGFLKSLVCVLNWIKSKTTSPATRHMLNDFYPFILRLTNIAIVLIALTTILRRFNVDIVGLVGVMGLSGVAIAWASKDFISNFFGGITIMMSRPFRMGDRISLDSGEKGDVYTIGLFNTQIKTFDHTLIVVPNSSMATAKITNHSYPDDLIKSRLSIGVGYDSDIPEVMRLMVEEIALKEPLVMQEPKPEVYLTDYGDSSINFLLRFWCQSFKDEFEAKHRMNLKIWELFVKEERVTIPFPMRTLDIDWKALKDIIQNKPLKD